MGQAGVGGRGGPRALSGDSPHADEDWASPLQLTALHQGAALCLPPAGGASETLVRMWVSWGSFRPWGHSSEKQGGCQVTEEARAASPTLTPPF